MHIDSCKQIQVRNQKANQIDLFIYISQKSMRLTKIGPHCKEDSQHTFHVLKVQLFSQAAK